ncbi:MAG: 3-dehydroquinate synthase [Gammaproteobacteria bacterium]|nr:3-dehydroquinate synthase [Gammaproteobacteria bacterium]NIR82223.1 3-dehydroquinate synthase [Gammaproteobacteria bacterium]NIR90822.1 3-dehydroquinate synthase [Gammaproteobacteria bacterium]NIU03373.1 3-dehydroquinate synthase [Gammaproteobacteria bacterium]NIV50869.1 3-dehydroquinate synthase [Gammaproteobacteria bacterium]
MKTLRVELEARSYSIYIGAGLMGRPEFITPLLAGNQAMVVTNETVGPLYLDRVLAALADVETQSVQLPDGEQFKTLETLQIIFDALLRARFGRDCTVVALGGGVVGDIAGFAAACYQRGVAHVQLPTTLLAQVDSSVGGKTGVNHPRGKNMIGAFHQPNGVIADTDSLATLPERELRAGLAEVIKYGAIRDAAFFEWLEAHLESLLERDPQAFEHAIYRSCYNKAEVVAEDEREAGARALLNFGHTFGHAIETGLGYGRWLHGEAVAAGMCLAARLSIRTGWLDDTAGRRIEALVARAGLPTRRPQELAPARMQELMAVDKKVRAGRPRLVLLHAIGDARVTDELDPHLVEATLAEQ